MFRVEKTHARVMAEAGISAAAIMALAIAFKDSSTTTLIGLSLIPGLTAAGFDSKWCARMFLLGSAGALVEGGGYTYPFFLLGAGVGGAVDFLEKRKNYDHVDDDDGEIH